MLQSAFSNLQNTCVGFMIADNLTDHDEPDQTYDGNIPLMGICSGIERSCSW